MERENICKKCGDYDAEVNSCTRRRRGNPYAVECDGFHAIGTGRYDTIETAADLVKEVRINGLSTRPEDLNRAANIFGNSTIEELVALANDNGMNNAKGEPDPNGTWTSGRKGTQQTFYFIAFRIWHWEDATCFFNQHTNPITKNAKKISDELTEANQEIDFFKKRIQDQKNTINNVSERIVNAEEALEEAQKEILVLKAKLYDMTAGKE